MSGFNYINIDEIKYKKYKILFTIFNLKENLLVNFKKWRGASAHPQPNVGSPLSALLCNESENVKRRVCCNLEPKQVNRKLKTLN